MVREAGIAALRDHMQIKPLGDMVVGADQSEHLPAAAIRSGGVECVVEMKHFLAAVAKTRPSVSEKVRLQP